MIAWINHPTFGMVKLKEVEMKGDTVYGRTDNTAVVRILGAGRIGFSKRLITGTGKEQ